MTDSDDIYATFYKLLHQIEALEAYAHKDGRESGGPVREGLDSETREPVQQIPSRAAANPVPSSQRGAGQELHPSPPPGPATGQGGGSGTGTAPVAGAAPIQEHPSAAPRNSFASWLGTPEAAEVIRKAVAESKQSPASFPLHEDGTPVSVGERVDRGGRVLTYTGPCAQGCGRPAFTTGATMHYPAGAYTCYGCYKEGR